MSFLYLSCTAIVSSSGCEFNRYKSMCLGISKNIVIVRFYTIM